MNKIEERSALATCYTGKETQACYHGQGKNRRQGNLGTTSDFGLSRDKCWDNTSNWLQTYSPSNATIRAMLPHASMYKCKTGPYPRASKFQYALFAPGQEHRGQSRPA